MSLFDFLANVGASILGSDPADDVKEYLNKELGDKLSKLNVEHDDGRVSLTGECDTQATKEKATLLAGNIKGVSVVDADKLTVTGSGSGPDHDEAEFYTIVKGDTLSHIAKHFYGDANKYPEIFEANREVIKDPDLIYPGQRIRIPKAGK